MPRKVKKQSLRGRRRNRSPNLKKQRKTKSVRKSKTISKRNTFCYRNKPQKKNHSNLSKFVKEVRNEPKVCQIMTPHGNIIDLPSEYPGDDFVFAELYTNPGDKYHAEMIDSSVLRDVYDKYHRMCF